MRRAQSQSLEFERVVRSILWERWRVPTLGVGDGPDTIEAWEGACFTEDFPYLV